MQVKYFNYLKKVLYYYSIVIFGYFLARRIIFYTLTATVNKLFEITSFLHVLTGGHSNKTKVPLKSGFKFNSDRETWSTSDVPEMNEARKDHACLFIQVLLKLILI